MANVDKKDKMQAVVAEVGSEMSKLEQAAMDKVLKKLGIDKDELEELARIKAQGEEMVDYDIGNIDVYVNGQSIPSKGSVPRSQAEQILALAASKRHRHMLELFGKKGMANLEGGVIRAEIAVTEVEDVSGKKVSQ